MDNRIYFGVLEDNSVVPFQLLAVSNLDTEEKCLDAFPNAKFREAWLKPPTGKTEMEIARKCQSQTLQGTVTDGLLEPYARILVMVEKWNFEQSPTLDFIQELPPTVSNELNQCILRYCFPQMTANKDFTTAWSKLQKGSAPENQSE